MNERPTTPAAANAERPTPDVPPMNESELRRVVERFARLQDELSLLVSANPEVAAIAAGVHPERITAARAALAEPRLRDLAEGWLAEAGRTRQREPASPPPAPRSPDQLLAEAGRRAGGLDILLSAAPETAAITFGVHPELILAARVTAGRRAARGRA